MHRNTVLAARSTRCAIVEDDYDHELHYDGRPVLPLASADTAGLVIYIGTLSKVLRELPEAVRRMAAARLS